MPDTVAEPSTINLRCLLIPTIITALFSSLDTRQQQSPVAQDQRHPQSRQTNAIANTLVSTRSNHPTVELQVATCQCQCWQPSRSRAMDCNRCWTYSATQHCHRSYCHGKKEAGIPNCFSCNTTQVCCMPGLLSSPSCMLAAAKKLEGSMWTTPSRNQLEPLTR
jgi:hypothetical protein